MPSEASLIRYHRFSRELQTVGVAFLAGGLLLPSQLARERKEKKDRERTWFQPSSKCFAWGCNGNARRMRVLLANVDTVVFDFMISSNKLHETRRTKQQTWSSLHQQERGSMALQTFL